MLVERSASPQPPARSTRSRDTTASDRPGTWSVRIMVVTAALTPLGGVPTAIVSPTSLRAVPVVLMASPVPPDDSPGVMVAILRFRTILVTWCEFAVLLSRPCRQQKLRSIWIAVELVAAAWWAVRVPGLAAIGDMTGPFRGRLTDP